ncbi:MAG TPA: hypothetical protein PKE07_03030 [Lacibacter sp.]|nr:hypothetical protein [Lacibacter sp.]HMO87727.1 hypothetical protein [Lacibacter sp.]
MQKQIIPIVLLLLLAVAPAARAQLKPANACGAIAVDVYKGWINEAKPNADPEQIKAKLPCFTSFEPEGNESKCGGGVYYADKDFKFLIQRDYIVIGAAFKGSFNLPLLGQKSDDLFVKLGNPRYRDANWEAYQMAYGTLLVLYNDKAVIHKVIISTKTPDELDLCGEM